MRLQAHTGTRGGTFLPTQVHEYTCARARRYVSSFQITLTAVTRFRRSVVVTGMNLHTGPAGTPPKAAKHNAVTSRNTKKPPRFGRKTGRQRNVPKTWTHQRKR